MWVPSGVHGRTASRASSSGRTYSCPVADREARTAGVPAHGTAGHAARASDVGAVATAGPLPGRRCPSAGTDEISMQPRPSASGIVITSPSRATISPLRRRYRGRRTCRRRSPATRTSRAAHRCRSRPRPVRRPRIDPDGHRLVRDSDRVAAEVRWRLTQDDRDGSARGLRGFCSRRACRQARACRS